ncbi:hypothetical protein AVEN_170442-1 [Araneus ventricosus]|uniref:Uncharacterized protein n=1 Tax=Araneus ventricosus TaxID=182803 RepID=A0A4Y2VYJ3_ARAVE|nr:hypothetical protein AVEN_170442-1 [Araneus ventricosus]
MILFKKGCKSVRQALEAGSLVIMHDQKEWTHAIPPQPCVKEPRISLTFLRVWSSLQQSLDEMERDYTQGGQPTGKPGIVREFRETGKKQGN